MRVDGLMCRITAGRTAPVAKCAEAAPRARPPKYGKRDKNLERSTSLAQVARRTVFGAPGRGMMAPLSVDVG